MEVKNKLCDIYFTHCIYREFNENVDKLSKEALSMQEGVLSTQ
jgi:hypothetical protein